MTPGQSPDRSLYLVPCRLVPCRPTPSGSYTVVFTTRSTSAPGRNDDVTLEDRGQERLGYIERLLITGNYFSSLSLFSGLKYRRSKRSTSTSRESCKGNWFTLNRLDFSSSFSVDVEPRGRHPSHSWSQKSHKTNRTHRGTLQ